MARTCNQHTRNSSHNALHASIFSVFTNLLMLCFTRHRDLLPVLKDSQTLFQSKNDQATNFDAPCIWGRHNAVIASAYHRQILLRSAWHPWGTLCLFISYCRNHQKQIKRTTRTTTQWNASSRQKSICRTGKLTRTPKWKFVARTNWENREVLEKRNVHQNWQRSCKQREHWYNVQLDHKYHLHKR